jgi:hypothetical protein
LLLFNSKFHPPSLGKKRKKKSKLSQRKFMPVERRRPAPNNSTNKRAVKDGVNIVRLYPHKVPLFVIPKAVGES